MGTIKHYLMKLNIRLRWETRFRNGLRRIRKRIFWCEILTQNKQQVSIRWPERLCSERVASVLLGNVQNMYT